VSSEHRGALRSAGACRTSSSSVAARLFSRRTHRRALKPSATLFTTPDGFGGPLGEVMGVVKEELNALVQQPHAARSRLSQTIVARYIDAPVILFEGTVMGHADLPYKRMLRPD
jgi:hypothetical protein